MYYTEYESPLGILTLISQENYLIRMEFGSFEDKHQKINKWLSKNMLPLELKKDQVPFQDILEQLNEYFYQKRRTFTIPYKFYGTSFQQKVWEALATQVPYGTTCSYQEIAHIVGSPKAVRAVGGANNQNPISIIVPCHRIIGKSGKLVGYGGGIDKKEFLLRLEKKH
ncbi:methylated-DNA--[protein]-cysteine S-methyltransferase [Gracilibacillus kekensis]|uniref:Methylated-DNA--protein-cysteine methyltransferase n=1 Tax=Gracilibacillus kekensis TaxID=1027249 RepID=A0A1M7PXI6_9BACI|nr:methylated-DNA--[protein]-cysteine S-methyltransferase [Gracilibacillus kekensis]SHN22313.1 methylated-DNA-[protein]-cysteine S-methyltransferase [Gracilibacillus kekensis]